MKYFIVLLMLMPSCILHHEPGRDVNMEPHLSNSVLALPSIKAVAKAHRPKDLYRVFSIQLVEYGKQAMKGTDLWLTIFPGQSVYDSIENLPILPESLCFGEILLGLEQVVTAVPINLQPSFVYQFLVNVVGTDKDGTNPQTFTIMSSFQVQKLTEIVPNPNCLIE